MAQKKKKEPEVKEEYEFIPPDFNEREFLEKDMSGTKTVLISALLAVVFGAVAFLLTDVSALIGALLLFVGAFSLKYIHKLMNIKVDMVENKTWIGNGAMFLFLALGIWILLLNPPFSDSVIPQIQDAQIWVGGHQVTSVSINTQAMFNATIVDNSALTSIQIEIHPSGNNTKVWFDMSEGIDGRWGYETSFLNVGTYFYTIKAVDSSGNANEFIKSFSVVA